MAETPKPVTPGSETTEFQVAQKSGTLAYVMLALGLVMQVGGVVAEAITGHPELVKWGLVVGLIVQIAGAVQKALVGMNYQNNRTALKQTAMETKTEMPKDGGPS